MKENIIKWTMLALALVATISSLIGVGARCVKDYRFDTGCAQYLKRAADANSIEIAKKELKQAISYAEEHNLTEGVVSIFFKQPENDVGFWYENMKASYEELESLPDNTSSLEKTNVLMKLRESLTDSSENGTSVTIPNGISIYPNNVAYFWWITISFISAIFFWIAWYIYKEPYYY